MKVVESKTSAQTQPKTASRQAEQPFFQRSLEGGQSAFFGQPTAETPSFFQPKLKIGAPNDHYEKQADAVADQVVAKMSEQSAVNSQQSTVNSQQSTVSRQQLAPSVKTASAPPAAVQAKCADCEKEEKLQKKDEEITSLSGGELQRKPIFESNNDPTDSDVQRKPMFDSASNDVLQKKSEGENTEGGASPNFESQLAASKSGGSSLPKDTQQTMGSAMGADFSGVRVHTGSDAANLSDNIGAKAFTHGKDVYFNEGQYNPSSTEGQKLLAHELTHTVQQGAAVQRKVAEPSPSVSETISAVSEQPLQRRPNTAVATPTSTEVVDISSGTFSPNEKTKTEIDAGARHQLEVKIKVGAFAQEGVVKIKKDKDNYDSVGENYLVLTNVWLQKVPGLLLRIDVKDNKVDGYVTTKGGDKANAWLKKIQAAEQAIGMGFKFKELPTENLVNKLEGGSLSLGFNNFTMVIGGFFNLGLNLTLVDMSTPVFDGTATMTMKGAEGTVSLNNKKEGKVSGEGKLTITGFKGFSGAIEVKYDAETGQLDIHGKAAYEGDKLSGSIELISTDEATAKDFAKQAIAAAGGKENIQNAPPPAPVPAPKPASTKRALAGVGVLTFNLTKWFAGTVNVVVDGEGHITVIGKIAPPATITLFEQKDFDKELFKFEAKAIYGIPVVGNLNVFANVSLHAIAKLGPALIKDIEIQGTYSTDPSVQKNISIAASLNISAYAGLRLRAEGGAGLTILSHDFKIGVGVNADVGVKAYAEARPTIGYRDPGEFYVSGTLEMVAQPMLGLSGDFFIEIDTPWWSPLSDDKWIWPIASKEWPLTDPIGINAAVKDYVLGSGKVPEVEFKKPEFDGAKFMTNMVDKQLPEKTGAGKDGQGSFKEDGSVQKPADVPVKPTDKKKGGDADKTKGGAKGDKGKGATGKKEEVKDAETLKKAGEMFKAADKPLKQIKGPLTKVDLNKKLSVVKGQVSGLELTPNLQGNDWVVTPKALGVASKTPLKIEAVVTEADKKAGDKGSEKGKDDIKNALAEIDKEGADAIKDGEVTKGDADKIAADVKQQHPTVVGSISVKDAEDDWDFEYIQKKDKKIPKKKEEIVEGEVLNQTTIAHKNGLMFTKEEPRKDKQLLGYKVKEKGGSKTSGIIVGESENNYIRERQTEHDFKSQYKKLDPMTVEERRKVIMSGASEHSDYKPEKVTIQSLGPGKVQVSYTYSKEAHDGGQQDFTVTINLDDVKNRIVTQTTEGKNLALKVPGTRGATDSAGVLAKKDYGIDLNSAHILADQFLGSGYKKGLNLILTSEKFNQETMADAESAIVKQIQVIMKNNSNKFVTFDMTVAATYKVLGDDQLIETLKGVKKNMSEASLKETLKQLQEKQDPRRCEVVNYLAKVSDENNKNLGSPKSSTSHGDEWLDNLFNKK